MAEYVMKDGTFSFQFNPRSIDEKYPALNLKIKKNDVEHELAVWIREGKFGMQLSGNTDQLQGFMRQLFGAAPKRTETAPESTTGQQPANQTPPARHVENRAGLIR